ncbi:hypothetical protein CC85DRAFT_1913 [Cutaneotrichosporon oleaginosum]|uniref:Chromo shadow domain-containing protein n=1 Tax=Cutaneotrichosporon oleaginosum TaxID=879819 RepID=A0A0J0XZF6_9TREE|nr:uncharacterized protein CC85DRAFT_1913 [Cutaneotrichosporon oleaginosum]KLT46421.1 hypothetical protein CC85DRAFT_1913 [Cutaneotrichosporon oleaginosum]TXT15209.1 hypothetical protein COLE_01402 [Cutaneotrichosporon oleaginosum]
MCHVLWALRCHTCHTRDHLPSTDVADWEPLVKQVDSIERGSDNTLVVYLTMKSGERICQGRDIVYRRCPQAMLRFYETYLKWRNDD